MTTTTNDRLGYLATTDELTNEIHNGRAYAISSDGTIAAGQSMIILGKVGNREVHFHNINGEFSQGNIRITLFEAPTITSNGTPILGTNMNRTFSDTHTMSVFMTPTITANGLKIGSIFFPLTGGGAHIAGASGGIASDRVLKKNTNYIIRIENVDNATVSLGANFIWSESNTTTAE